MTPKEVMDELEVIRLSLYRMRLKAKHAVWLAHLLKSIEVLVKATSQSVNHVAKTTGDDETRNENAQR